MFNALLVDRRNFDAVAPKIISEIKGSASKLIGFDLETEDDKRHAGLDAFMNIDPKTRRKAKDKKLVFDHRRTNVCGFSIYPDGGDTAYYINLAHADTQNRVSWGEARAIPDAIKEAEAYFVAHNAPFELRMMGESLKYEIEKIICTLQQAVSAYGPDEYDPTTFVAAGLGGLTVLLGRASKLFQMYDGRTEMSADQSEVFSQVIAKESDADHSYNGLVKSVCYGYDLKKAVRSWLGHQMTTFEQVIGDRAHMGQLTGEETVAYGADDAYWCIQLYHRLLKYMIDTNPRVVTTFFEQELPMVHVYSDVAREGLAVNLTSIESRRKNERHEAAVVTRKLKAAINALLPFNTEPNEKLAKHEDWYAKKHFVYRTRTELWAATPDSEDDFTQAYQIAGAVSSGWATDLGKGKSIGPNFTHHMMARTLLYDLIGEKLIIEKGKVQSDAEARGKLQNRLEKKLKELQERPGVHPDPMMGRYEAAIEVLKALAALAGIETRMKLYLTPYMQLTDPATQRMHPVLSSKLASRRMGCSTPNGMQLAKRGESTYVRGFFEADEPDHVILSRDWSGVELVEIGDFSGDPEFAKAFGQIPYEDLHSGAAADILAVEVEGMTAELFKKLGSMSFEEVRDISPRLVTNLKGEIMIDPIKIQKYWRTEIGKGANFNYFYSGALSTVGERMGWTSDQMWAATDKYRQRFAVAEAWRVGEIEKAQRDGYIMLPDGHRRVRFEGTQAWSQIMWAKFARYEDQGLDNFCRAIVKAVKSRSNNQIINSLIQGSCATLAKRSIVRINDRIRKEGWKARFMLPIHDELLFSVHKKEVIEFAKVVNDVMCDHPDIVKTLPLDSTASIGLTFEPFSKKSPIGQIELDEAPSVEWLPKESWGTRLGDADRQMVLDYLFENKSQLRMAA
jgi:DNA polymerase I-like protein with 3'-5' exonuclease and polymerase domains